MSVQIDLRRILELTDTLYEASESPSLWGSFLQGLAEVLDAHGYCLSQVAPEKPPLRLNSLDSLEISVEEISLWFADLAASRSEVLAVVEHDHRLAAVLGGEGGVLTIIGLVRNPVGPPFSRDASEVLALLIPLIARALRLQRILSARTSQVDLPPRQREVLALGAKGLRSKEIAKVLGVSSRTVEHHFTEAARRLNARSRSQAIALALEQRVIAAEEGIPADDTRKK